MSITHHMTAGLPETDEARERFRIEKDYQADWALQRLAEHQAAIAEIDDLADGHILLANEWRDKEHKAHDGHAEYFRFILTEYACMLRLEGRKSFSLPHGSVRTRETPAGFNVLDLAAIVEWAKANRPSAVVTSEKVHVKDLTGIVEHDGYMIDGDSGELAPIPGIEFKPASVSVSVNV